jgi:SAM-dependent methyltransferase
MKPLDHFVQRWRINKARSYVSGKSVLDIGSYDGALYRLLPGITYYFGVDPAVASEKRELNYNLVRGFFPAQVPDNLRFDVITLFAVLEHIPLAEQHPLARNCYAYLNSGGYILITVPSPIVDLIVDVLKFLRLADGMSIEEHYGFDIRQTPDIFQSAGFRLVKHETFQLGLNNLFMFVKP